MSEIDHRAKAVQLLAAANDRHADADFAGGVTLTAQAQVHATLAAGGGDLAERYRRAYAETLAERDELRAAVREFVTAERVGPIAEYDRGLQRLRELVGA